MSAPVNWVQEWHRLSCTAINLATGHYLRGCANVAMARSPRLAIEAMQQTQTALLSHSAQVLAEAIMLWHKQNTNVLVMRTNLQHMPDRKRSDLHKPTDDEVR